jgi:hypothetical protein
MTTPPDKDEERLAVLLRALAPPPDDWVKAAQTLPQARREIDEIAERVAADQAFRAAVLEDLETALEQAGYDLDPRLLPVVKERISRS